MTKQTCWSKRLLSGILAVLMVLSISGGQLAQVAAQSRIPTVLSAERIPKENLPTGNLVYFGTASATLDEDDRYFAVPIYREGDLTSEVTVEVRTMDMTAVYGQDYELYMYGVKVVSNGQSVLQTYMEGAQNANGKLVEQDPPTTSQEAEEVQASQPGKLAQLKENATGQPTRDTYETASEDLVSSIAQSMLPETIKELDHSAELTVKFAPGEDEKLITFRLMDDSKSEGTENFTLTLGETMGVEPYSVTNCSITITDDEPLVHSTVSFTATRYDSSKGIATVTVERTGAEYSLVDMRIFTSEDTAKADINYDSMDAILSFMPYETKKDVEFYVGGAGYFTVLLDGFNACQPGRYTRTKVYISPEDSAPKLKNSSNNTQSFTITLPQAIGEKNFTVEYVSGQPTGKIMDYSYSPALEVGCYYFALPSEKDGYFHYSTSNFTGTDPGWKGTLTCEYVEQTAQHESYGLLEYYHSTAWKEGKVWAYGNVVMPGVYYQYVSADWETTSNFGNYQHYRLNSTTLGLKKELTKDEKFSRTQSNAALVLLNKGNTQYNKLFHVSVDAYDSNDYTPKCYLRFYGAVAMYKSYKISVNEPTAMQYLTGTGGTVSNVPAQVSVRCGAQDPLIGGSSESRYIFANPVAEQSNLVFSLDASTINGANGKFGVLTGYTIAIDPGKSADKVSVNYPEDFISYLQGRKGTTGTISKYGSSAVDKKIQDIQKNLDTIAYDSYFIDWIDSLQKNVVNMGLGYYQNLVFTPKFRYVDVTVQVGAPDSTAATGAFTDAILSKEGTYTYHAGDVLDLHAVCHTEGYRVVGYQYSVDGEITSDIVTSTKQLLLLPQYSNYIIRPVIAENDNCIEIRYDGDKSNILGINSQGLISDSLLANEGLSGRYVLNLNPQGKNADQQMTPEVGKVYSVCFKSYVKDGKTYVPVITDAFGRVYSTQRFDFAASQKAKNNVLTLTYRELTNPQTYTITGNLVSNYRPILATGLQTQRLGVENFTVSLPTQQIVSNGITLIDTASDRTTDTGSFTLQGIQGQSGDRLTMLVSNGGTTQVVEVVLGNSAEQNVGELVLDYPRDAPYVVSLQYRYEKDANNASVDNSNNSVRIVDDSLIISIVVNSMDRNITEAKFTTYTAYSNSEREYSAYADPENPGVFTVKISKMTENLYNGHRIRVSLIEKQTVTYEDGKSDTVKIEYPAVETGLVFYVENVLLVPQTYDTPSTPTVNIPVLGSANASASTGLLGFSRTNWAGNTGYTLSINVDAVAGTTSLSTQDKLAKYNTLSKSAETAYYAKKDAAAIEAAVENSAGYLIEKLAKENTDPDRLLESMKTIGHQIDAAEDSMERIKAAGKQAKNAVAGYSNANVLKVDILVLIAFDFVYNPTTEEYVFCSGSVSLGGSVNYSKSIYFVVYGMPLYLNLTGFLQADLTVYYPNSGVDTLTAAQFEAYAGNIAERMSEVDANMTIMLNLKASVGVGMCNVIGAGGSLAFKMQFCVPFTSDEYGVLFSATGSLYVDLLVGRLNVDMVTATIGLGKYEGKTGFDYIGENLWLSSARQASAEDTAGMQDYGAGTADLSGFGSNGLIQATPEEVRRTILLEDAAERTAPQIVDLGSGKKLIVFIGNRGAGDALSSRALFWSVYNKGVWSAPQLVADDGTFDASPTVLQKNGKVVVAWVDADGSASGQSTTVEKLNSLGISVAIYENGTMGKEISLVEDEFFNSAPQLNLVGDTLYCSYMKRDISGVTTDEDLLDMTGTYSTMAHVACDIPSRTVREEQFVVIQHSTLTDPLVMDYHCVTTTMGGEDYLLATYTVDEDGNLNSGEDREMFLSITNLTTDTTYYPIQLTSDQTNQALPKLTALDGLVYLSWLEEGSVFHLLNVSEILEGFFHADQVGDVYRSSTGAGWYRKSAADLPNLSSVTYEGSFYDLASRDLFFDDAVNLHPDRNSSISISNYILTTNGDDLYLFYTDFGSEDPNDLGMELYGLRYQRDMADDDVQEEWGFGMPVKITAYGKVIDEFDLYMTKDNKISMVSNHYKQWIDSTGVTRRGANELVEIDFDTRSSLAIVGNVNLPDQLVGGESGTITFDIVNDGLMDTTGFNVTVFQISGDEQQTIYTGSYGTQLDSGESCQLELPWIIPEDVSNIQLRVVVTERDASISKPAEAVVAVPYHSALNFTDITVDQENGAYYINATVTNLGNADAPAATAQVGTTKGTKMEKLYATGFIPALASGESTRIKLSFTPAPEDFSALGVIDLTLRAVNGDELLKDGYAKLVCAQPAVVQINGGADTVALNTGKQAALTTKVAPWDQMAGEVRYTSSDATVAYVDHNGNVHGAGEGTATVTAYYPILGISDTTQVTVTQGSDTPGSPETGDTNTLWLLAPLFFSTATLAVLLLNRKKGIRA